MNESLPGFFSLFIISTTTTIASEESTSGICEIKARAAIQKYLVRSEGVLHNRTRQGKIDSRTTDEEQDLCIAKQYSA